MDGGTLLLIFKNPSSERKEISLVQNMRAEYYEELEDPPARIFIDGQIVEKRSELEEFLIEFLENDVSKKISKDELKLLQKKISFIKSNEYFSFAPIKLELTEKRKKYILLKEIIRNQNLNPIENKFLELRDETIKIKEFEKWVYANEEMVIEQSSSLIYDDLIILDYRDAVKITYRFSGNSIAKIR